MLSPAFRSIGSGRLIEGTREKNFLLRFVGEVFSNEMIRVQGSDQPKFSKAE